MHFLEWQCAAANVLQYLLSAALLHSRLRRIKVLRLLLNAPKTAEVCMYRGRWFAFMRVKLLIAGASDNAGANRLDDPHVRQYHLPYDYQILCASIPVQPGPCARKECKPTPAAPPCIEDC
jgi:hypothetical protein